MTILLTLIIGMIAFVIIRLQMVMIEVSWLRKYIMQILTVEMVKRDHAKRDAPQVEEINDENVSTKPEEDDFAEKEREETEETSREAEVDNQENEAHQEQEDLLDVQLEENVEKAGDDDEEG